MTGQPEEAAPSIYDRSRGESSFLLLIERFYARVEHDPPLRSLYPENLEPGATDFALFMSQRFGGPPTYSERKGHPRLRMRHNPFAITPDGAQRWITHMVAAVDELVASGEFDEAAGQELRDYAIGFAPQMVNTYDDPKGPLPIA